MIKKCPSCSTYSPADSSCIVCPPGERRPSIEEMENVIKNLQALTAWALSLKQRLTKGEKQNEG